MEIIETLGSFEDLASCDPDLEKFLKEHNFGELTRVVKEANESEDFGLILRVADQLEDVGTGVRDLAGERDVPFYMHDFGAMKRFLEKDPDEMSQAERVYNLIGYAIVCLILGLTYKVIYKAIKQ